MLASVGNRGRPFHAMKWDEISLRDPMSLSLVPPAVSRTKLVTSGEQSPIQTQVSSAQELFVAQTAGSSGRQVSIKVTVPMCRLAGERKMFHVEHFGFRKKLGVLVGNQFVPRGTFSQDSSFCTAV
jgi:hypothetical protein